MSLPEEIMRELEDMNEYQRREVLDFTRFLRQKEERALDDLMDSIIDQNMEALKELGK